jgi:ubiquinone/menaquinone biosynthesis C-methylase UbiE
MDDPGARSDVSADRAVVSEYARLAPKYDEKWSFYVEATTRETLARLSLRRADRLLDVGCGTGALLHRLSRSHSPSRLSGVDPVPEMLAVARRRLPPEVELRDGWAERLPFEADRFDVVVSCNMFHYIRDPALALREMGRVLRPGGRLVITDWCDDYLACRVCDWYLRRFSRAHFKVYRERECLRLLREAGHREPHIERYKISWLWGLMTAMALKATDGDPVP